MKKNNIGFNLINRGGETYLRNGAEDFKPEEMISKIRQYNSSNKIKNSIKLERENYTVYIFELEDKNIRIYVTNDEKSKSKFVVETLDDLCVVGATIKKENKKKFKRLILAGVALTLSTIVLVGLSAQFINSYNENYGYVSESTTSIEQTYEAHSIHLLGQALNGDVYALGELTEKAEANWPGAKEALKQYYELVNTDDWKTDEIIEQERMEEEILSYAKSMGND